MSLTNLDLSAEKRRMLTAESRRDVHRKSCLEKTRRSTRVSFDGKLIDILSEKGNLFHDFYVSDEFF